MMHSDRIWIDPAYADHLSRLGLTDVARVLARTDGSVCAWSRTTDTVFIANPDPVQPGVYLKRYHYPRWRNRLRGAFRGTFVGTHRADAEAALLREMRSRGIPAVRPIAGGSRRIGHFVTSCFLITEEVPGSCNLTTFAADVLAGRRHMPPSARREALSQFAASVAALHGSGFLHGQLYWRNILIHRTPLGESAFHYLDARPRGRTRNLVSGPRGWIEELGHLLASAEPCTTRREQLRFLARYLQIRGLTLENSEFAQIAEVADRKRVHEAQRIVMNDRFERWGRELRVEQAAATLRLTQAQQQPTFAASAEPGR